MSVKINIGFGNYLTPLDANEKCEIDDAFTERCVMCREPIDECNKSDEHIFPKWLQDRFNLQNKKITLPNNSTTLYRQFLVPCCKECNNGVMSAWEKIIEAATTKGYDEFIKLDKEIIVWWLLKIYYSKAVRELTFKGNIKDPNSPMMLSESDILAYKNIYYYMCQLIKGVKFNNPKPYELYIYRTQDNGCFDYIDDALRHVVYMQMNDILVVCSFDSFDVFSIQYKTELKALNNFDFVHPLQAIELFAKIVYYKSHYSFDSYHGETIGCDGVKINTEIKNIDQVRDFNAYELYTLLSEAFKLRGFNDILPYKDGAMISTIPIKKDTFFACLKE